MHDCLVYFLKHMIFESVYTAANTNASPDEFVKQFVETQREYDDINVREYNDDNITSYCCGYVDAHTIELDVEISKKTSEVSFKANFIAANGEMYGMYKCNSFEQFSPDIVMEPLGFKYTDRDQTRLDREGVIALIRTIGQKLRAITRHYGYVVDSFRSPTRKRRHGDINFRIDWDDPVQIYVSFGYGAKDTDDDDMLKRDVGLVEIETSYKTTNCAMHHYVELYINAEHLLAASDEFIKFFI